MAVLLIADECFDNRVTRALRRFGYQILKVTALKSDPRATGPRDASIVEMAHRLGRAILTDDSDFDKYHEEGHPHSGIIRCEKDNKHPAEKADRIHAAIEAKVIECGTLVQQYIFVERPSADIGTE